MEPRPDHQFDPQSSESGIYDDPDRKFENIDHADPLALFKAIGAGKPGGLPMPQLMSPEKVRQQAKTFSTSIFQDFAILNSILARHEITIQRRWKKKTQEQRRKVLLPAWEGPMSKYHRPDFEAFRKETEAQRESGTAYRDAFMWPYINQEDLARPKTLLLFLNSRGRNSPATFAAADYEAMHLGLVTKGIVPVFLNEHVMLFKKNAGPDTYGQLMHWNDHPDAFQWMMSRKEHQPGEGLLILEAQARIMHFLVRCAKMIIPDIAIHELLQGPIQPDPPSVSDSETGLASLAGMIAEAPYRAPYQLDFARIESLLAAKRDEAADHAWSLREDPGYFSLQIREVWEHRQELIKDDDNSAHPLFRQNRQDILWGRVLSSVTLESCLMVEIWTELHRQCAELKTMQARYSATIDSQGELPEKYLHALLTFRHWLYQAAKGPIGQLKIAVVASPPWRHLFQRKPVYSPTTTAIVVCQKPNTKLSKIQEQMLWLLRTIWEDGKPLFFAGMTNIVDELQHLVEASKEAADMLTAYTAGVIADLSVVTECLHQLNLYQPWANTFEDALVDRKEGIMKSFAERTKTWSLMMKALGGDTEKILATHGSPEEENFQYPVDKRRTRENVSMMRQSEANLDKFWSTVDEIMYRRANAMQDTTTRALLADRQLQRTPEWVEPTKEEICRGVLHASDLTRPLSELYLDLERRTEHTVSKQKPVPSSKVKMKTRGDPDAAKELVANQPNRANDAHDPQPTFQVDARALKVFKNLFFAPSMAATPGEIPWTDFLHAMVSTGFRAEKLYGSVWQFDPTTLDVERSIHFHEPHPASKIPFLIARRYGRRLNRAYGWHAGMFQLASKGPSGT